MPTHYPETPLPLHNNLARRPSKYLDAYSPNLQKAKNKKADMLRSKCSWPKSVVRVQLLTMFNNKYAYH